MKNFLLILALSLAVIGAIVSFVGMQKVEKIETTSLDSAAIVQLLESQKNPSFTSVEQVLAYRQTLKKECFIDSVMDAMPTETLTDVITVLINKKGSATQADIVEEFRQNKQVYSHLHPTATENPAANTSLGTSLPSAYCTSPLLTETVSTRELIANILFLES